MNLNDTNTTDQQPAPERESGAGWYDHPTSRPTSTPAAEPKPDAEPGSRLFVKDPPPEVKFDVPEAVAKLRETNSKMFDPEPPYEQAISADDFVEDGAPEHVKTAVLGELRRMAHDTGIAPTEAREVVDIAKQLVAEPPDESTQQGWRESAVKRVMDLNSGNVAAAQRDVDLARQLVARDPRLVKLLEVTRLGDHPAVIEKFVQLARRERQRGRL
jgi:hypothetical protein